MFLSKSRKRSAEINALSEFANEEEYSGLRDNIKKGLIGIIDSKWHCSNGLLISEDGYFLTPEHCTNQLSNKSVKLYDGKEYGIEKLCAINKKEDIALAKARIPGRCNPRRYNFESEIKERDIIALYTRIDGKLLDNYGFVYSQRNLAKTHCGKNGELEHYRNQFMINIHGKPGYSGSIIINKERKILGLLSGGNCDIDIVTGIRISKAIELVKFYVKILQSNIG